MARLVVLEFADNDNADLFVKSINWESDVTGKANPVVIDSRQYPDDSVGNVDATVVGLFALPVNFCEGSLTTGCLPHRGKLGWYWVLGQKFGWWVCRVCKKPARPKSHENLIRNVVGEAVNLLTDSSLEEQTVFDAGWGAYRNDTAVPDTWRQGVPLDDYVPERVPDEEGKDHRAE